MLGMWQIRRTLDFQSTRAVLVARIEYVWRHQHGFDG
jgi:hypothetical protein